MEKLNKHIFIILIILANFFVCNIVFASDETTELSIDSEAAILIENDSQNILYEKNSSEKLYPASTTKIMTAILIIENCNLDEVATVSQNAIDLVPSGYTNAGLVAGEKLTIEDLLYALMLASANEAANVLAEHLSGSIDNFAILMTEKAKELGCTNTNFVNANGMHDDNHYTTAEDLAIIAKYCFENETFRKIIETVTYTIPATEQHPEADRILTNTDALINESSEYYYKYALGGKTGYTSQAGCCLVCFAKKEDTYLTCVILKASSSANRFSDAKKLLSYGYENFSNQVILSKDIVVDTIEISNASKDSRNVELVIGESVSDYIENDFDENNYNFDFKIDLNDNLSAPIYAGTEVGTVTFTLNEKEYTTSLVAKTTAYTATNYASYILAIGLVLLITSIIIIPKKRNKLD